MTAPYIVRPTGPGAADVVDRKTGEPVGNVERVGRSTWLAFAAGRKPARLQYRIRRDAARALWEARQ